MDDTYPFTSNWNSPTIRSEKLIHSFKMYSLYATQIIPVNQTLHCLFLIHGYDLIRKPVFAQPSNAFFYQSYTKHFQKHYEYALPEPLFFSIILLFLKSLQWQYRRYQSTLYIQACYSTMHIELIRPDHIRTSNYNYDNAPRYWIQNGLLWVPLHLDRSLKVTRC